MNAVCVPSVDGCSHTGTVVADFFNRLAFPDREPASTSYLTASKGLTVEGDQSVGLNYYENQRLVVCILLWQPAVTAK
jgi:hypothetical protein